jgi:NitT/TauT family transport system substrate-binding protein
MPFASDLAIFVALEKGYFQREGVDVELVKFQSATENLNALLAKRTDMAGMIGISTLLLAFEKAPDQFRAFLGTAETETHWGSALLVPPDSPIRSISDLKGKVVGTYEGTTQLMNLRSILQNFMDPDKDVTIRQVRTDLQLPSLGSKQFDALFTIEPSVTTAVDKGIGRVLEENPRYKYILKPFPVTANCVSLDFWRKNPDAVKSVYRALVSASRDIRSDEAATKKYLPKYTPLDTALAEKCRLYHWWLPQEVDLQAIQKLADLFREQGLLKSEVKTSAMFLDLEK